jgi:hypothetical protein
MLLVTALLCVIGQVQIESLLNTCVEQVETSLVSHLLELVDEADKDKNGKIDFDEFDFMGKLLPSPSISPGLSRNSFENQTAYPYGRVSFEEGELELSLYLPFDATVSHGRSECYSTCTTRTQTTACH